MRTALGMIVKSLNSDDEVVRFLKNADKHNHKIDCVIVAYSQHIDPGAVVSINKKVPLFTIDINKPVFCDEQFRHRGISAAASQTLLECPIDSVDGLVPYGFNRTMVVIEAILRGVEILFFVDNDVSPLVLKKTPDGLSLTDEDFFGAHLEYLENGSQITTGEYSGYNILPPASFECMDDLLLGLQKGDMIQYWQSSKHHDCLAVEPAERVIRPCSKILGGNVAITLSVFTKIPPFFSSTHMLGGELFLNRGEDSLLGYFIEKNGITCTDIGRMPFHDTYRNYPIKPDLQGDPLAQNRFFYACTGWVGRNPFYNYLYGNDLKSTEESQFKHLERGLRALAEYTSNPRFYSVLRNFKVSWGDLGRYISEYERVLEAWDEFIERCDIV